MASQSFSLCKELLQTTAFVDSWPLSDVLLSVDANYPGWLLLVPRKPNATEIIDLSSPEQEMLMQEISRASKVVQRVCRPDKLNIGALGNVVAQLHIHIVPRFKSDIAWPGPVWGAHPIKPFPEDELQAILAKIKDSVEDGIHG